MSACLLYILNSAAESFGSFSSTTGSAALDVARGSEAGIGEVAILEDWSEIVLTLD